MTYHRKYLLASLGLCAALGAGSGWAQVETEVVTPPAPQTYGSIGVINGGANFDEADAIKRIQSRYPLRVEISGRGGNYYVADRVKVLQGDEVVAEIPNAGPWLLMDLPPGRYTLVGDFGITELRRDVVVSNHGTKVSWVVPSKVD
jgi:hypothetical protein